MDVRRLAVVAVAALLAGLAAGWIWASWGTFDTEDALADVTVRLNLTDARAEVLDARVSFHLLNFGDASGHLERAKAPLGPARARFETLRQVDRVKLIDEALAHIDAARGLASKVDQSAGQRAADASRALDAALR